MTTLTVDALTEARTRQTLTTANAYSLHGYSEMPARAGVAWHATIRKDGAEVGQVHDAGYGGCLDFEWTGSQHMYAFNAEAKARYGDHPEAGDAFAHDMATAAQYNRKRSVIFINDDSALSMGESFTFKAAVTRARVKAALLNPTHPLAGKNPMIWDKSQSMFVAVADIEA